MIYWIFSLVLTAIDTWCVLYLLDTFLKKKDAGRLEKFRFVLFYGANILVAVLFHVLGVVINCIMVRRIQTKFKIVYR